MKGFTLLETIVAVGVLAIGIVASLTLVSKSVQTVRMSQNRLIASYLAQEGVELVRNIRDGNWNNGDPWDDWDGDGNSDSGSYIYCEIDYNNNDINLTACDSDLLSPFLILDSAGSTKSYSYDLGGRDTIFKRSIFIGSLGSDQKQITSYVTWTDRGTNHNVVIIALLYNWGPP